MNMLSPVVSNDSPITLDQVGEITETNQVITRQDADPVRTLIPVIEIFLPIGPAETNTMFGLWFDTVGLLHVYVQQAGVPDNIYTQIKILTLRLPSALGFLIFNIGLAQFFARAFILSNRATRSETANEIKSLLENVIRRIQGGNYR